MNLKMLIYCTKAKPYLSRIWKNQFELASLKEIVEQDALNGKIVAVNDFDCEEIIHTFENGASVHHDYSTKTLDNEQLLRKSRIIGQAIDEYLGNRQYGKNNNVVGYAIHIKNLQVFDKPKELSDFYRYDNSYDNMFGWAFEDREKFIPLKKAPQNMMFCYDKDGNKYVVISVHPEWLCLILNGLKDVEVRRKVLKEMN